MQTTKQTTVVLSFSGGLDSSVLLAYLLSEGMAVLPVFFNYGSRQNAQEEKTARDLALHYGLALRIVDQQNVFSNFQSDLLKRDGSCDNYTVPARNIIFGSILAGIAWTEGAEHIAFGFHKEEAGTDSDSGRDFAKALDLCVFIGTEKRVSLYNPLGHLERKEFVSLGLRLGVPLDKTYTCYTGSSPCGVCSACVSRHEAYSAAGYPELDPNGKTGLWFKKDK